MKIGDYISMPLFSDKADGSGSRYTQMNPARVVELREPEIIVVDLGYTWTTNHSKSVKNFQSERCVGCCNGILFKLSAEQATPIERGVLIWENGGIKLIGEPCAIEIPMPDCEREQVGQMTMAFA